MPTKSVREMTRRERRRHSLSGKTFRSMLLVCAVLSALAIVFGYVLFSSTVNREYRTRTWQISKTAASLIEKRTMRREAEEVLRVYRETGEKCADTDFAFTHLAEFGETQRVLTDLRHEGDAIAAYVAALDRESNRMIMILDSDETDTFCPPGTLFSYLPGEINDWINGSASGMFDSVYGVDPMPSVINRSDAYGFRCTAATPLFEIEGYPVFAFVDTDMNTARRAGHIFLSQYVLLLFGAALISAFFAIRNMRKNMVGPINELAEAAEAYTKDRVDDHRTGAHFARVDISTGDEIENLSLAMKDMEQELGDYVLSLTRATAEKERIGVELNIASQIQEGMIPNIFPPFPEREEFDIYAAMHTAKEVGGDFYDFFLIDDDHLALVMADVSGKGVPAALFMMASKIIIKSSAMLARTSPAQILERVNHTLCQNNSAKMFVTTWLGILEISTGRLTASNAGHEYPTVRKDGAPFQLFRDPHGFVLGGMDGMRYRDYEITFAPGDALFVYTDGVTEATDDAGTLFGTERMLQALNKAGDGGPQDVLHAVKCEIDAFTGDAPQFDDITMLCIKYLGPQAKKLTIKADAAKLPEVLAFIDAELEAADCPMKPQMQIDVAVEEIFVNIASYAYNPGSGIAVIGIQVKDGVAEITFADSGIPYDPLAREDPDVSLPAEKREIGGLGVYLVKQTMDDVRYEYRDGQNLLTIVKKL